MSEASKEEMERQVTKMIDVYTKALTWINDKVATHETPPDIPAYLMVCHAVAEYLEINNFDPQELKDLEEAISGIVHRHLEDNGLYIPINPSLN